MSKIAVLIPDYFWSSIPYDGLTLCMSLREKFGHDVDLLMFSADIRLNKDFIKAKNGYYRFSPNLFTRQNPILLKNWDHFYEVSQNYKLILTQTHIAPKIRLPEFDSPFAFKNKTQCPLLFWDIGGSDLLSIVNRGTYFCVKGEIWKRWCIAKGVEEKNIFVTGTPHYDYYLHSDKIPLPEARILSKNDFYAKYKIPKNKKLILIAPSNPGSHKDQFSDNLNTIGGIINFADAFGYQVIIKTYPHDYVFYDKGAPYSGIYHRLYSNKPQYKLLKERLPKAKIIESQDHFCSVLYSAKMYNMSGSHLAWETYYSDCESYTMNYKDKPYYNGAEYLPGIKLPDNYFNIHLDKVEDIFLSRKKNTKNCHEYMSKEFAHKNIVNVVEKLL